MTKDSGGSTRSTPHTARSRTTAQWTPAAYEHVSVSRPMDRPLADIERVLKIQPHRLLHIAYGTEVAPTGTVVSLRIFTSLPWLRVPTRVEFSTPPPHHSGTISLKWEAAHLSRYFPVLEADIGVRPDADKANLVLEGTYKPPLGIVGLVFDHLVGRRFATAAATGFVDALAASIDRGEKGGPDRDGPYRDGPDREENGP